MGHGPLPPRMISACRATGRDFFVIAFEGQTESAMVEGLPHLWTRLGAIGEVLEGLREAAVSEVVLCGKMHRPSLSSLKLDWRGVKLMKKIGKASAQGDNAIFQTIVNELEEEGYRVVGADVILAELLTPPGVLGAVEPDEGALSDVAVGMRVARRLGELDVGQAAVVQQGLVLGVEACEGTDALLARCAELSRSGAGGVLVKVKKPDQERRVDLPTIGIGTVRRAHGAGLRGIALEAGESLIIDRREVIEEADGAGVFLLGIETEPEEDDDPERLDPPIP